jgi:sialate O-acetylesterase
MKAALLTIVLAVCSVQVRADVRLPKIFTDHMVLQQERPIAVWGHAEPGCTVTVTLHGANTTAKADQRGQWRVDLPAMKADGEARTLAVTTGSEKIELNDVLLGEVWICGGQSNMGRPVTGEQIRSADYPKIRLLNISGNTPREEGIDDAFGWAICFPDVIARAGDGSQEKGRRGFTQVGYVFGRRIHEELGVPVGLIQMNCGGSTAKDWTPTPGVAESLNYDEPTQGLTHKPGVLYEVRMRGLVPYTARGVVWYQGEDDGRNRQYAEDLSAMIAAWRRLFGREDLPFYFAQIAQTTYASGMLGVWEAQRWVMENVPHTGLAVSNDIYDGTTNGGFKQRIDEKTGLPIASGGNPHPTGKHKIAERLARIALDRTYGKPQGVLFGPMYDSCRIEGNKILVKFEHAGSGLKSNDEAAPNWFEISDGTKERNRTVYVRAEARIVGSDTVAVSANGNCAEGVSQPKHVRFGWHSLARFNLINKEGLPAVSFRTDDDPR